MDDEMKHLRFEFLMNGTRKSKFIKPLEPPWYNTHMKPLLEAQFKVHEDRALDDVEHMISRGERKMTGTRERKKYEKKECGPVVLRLIQEWDDKKMEELREMKGPETVERDRKDRAARRAQTDENLIQMKNV